MDFRDFCFFSLFYTYFELKSIHYLTSFCRKKDSQFDRKKETYVMKEERELFFACYILGIYYSLNSINHWIDLNLGYYSCNIVDIHSVHPPFCWGGRTSYQIFKKGGLTGPQVWEGVAGKEEVIFFKRGGGAILQKKTN